MAPMVKVYVSSVIDAPADAVWAVIRGFNDLPEWHPAIRRSHIEGGMEADRVGAIRNFDTVDGGHIREKLIALSDYEYACTYAMLEATLDLRDYIATLRLLPVTDGSRTFIEWTADFHTEPGHEGEMARTVADGVFQTGFDALKERFAT
jgi:hypothetical protein